MRLTIDSGLLEKAIESAVLWHKGQVDKCGKPYILHPLAVMLMGETLGEQIVGVLHDLVEDTNCIFCDIKIIFGDTISDAIDAITRRSFKDVGVGGCPRERYNDYIQRCGKNPLARKVKINDLLHNMSPERVDNLPENEKGIVERYKKALEYLKGLEK